MIWIILGIILTGLHLLRAKRSTFPDPFLYIVPSVFILGLVVLVPNGFISMYTNEYTNCTTHQLVSIQDGAGESGQFFLGTGSKNDLPVFYFYQKNNDSYRLMRVSADDSVVKVDSDPRRMVCSPSSSNKWLSIFSPGLDHNTFYVPEGSIVNSFNLDAK